jgi:hypothetical protein
MKSLGIILANIAQWMTNHNKYEAIIRNEVVELEDTEMGILANELPTAFMKNKSLNQAGLKNDFYKLISNLPQQPKAVALIRSMLLTKFESFKSKKGGNRRRTRKLH